MARNIIRVSTELYPVQESSWNAVRKLPLHYYRLTPSSQFLKRTGDLRSVYSYVTKHFGHVFPQATVIRSELGLELVSPSPATVETIYTEERLSGESKVDVVASREPSALDLDIPDQYQAFLHLFYQSQRDYYKLQGYSVRGKSVFKPGDELTPNIASSKNDFLRKIQSFIHLYPGFDVRFRLIEGSPFVQIQPKSVLEFEKDLHSLIRDGIVTRGEIERNFEEIRLPIDRTAKLHGLISKTAKESLSEPPFYGRSFLEYSRQNYSGMTFEAPEAPMLVAFPIGADAPWYFTSELVRPSLSFFELSRYDPQYAATLTSAMKVYSASRALGLDRLRKDLRFGFLGTELAIGEAYSRDGPDIEVATADSLQFDSASSFLHFPRPWVQFRDTNGDAVHIGGPPHLAAPGDLLRDRLRDRKLRPFDVPTHSKIRIKVICDNSFTSDAQELLRNLQSGFGKHPSFEDIFQCDFDVTKFSSVAGFEDMSAYSDISRDVYDIVIVFGPRSLAGDPVRTKSIYTFAETNILSKGVPPQFISDNPSKNPSYDASLRSKAGNPNVLFGIGLNILGKIGAKVMDLSLKSGRLFVADSVVLAYNIARVFEPLNQELSSTASPREAARASSAISAPIVVMTDRGTEIIHQSAHKISSETTLFSSEHGQRVLGEIPSRYTTVIIHKDGAFHNEELRDIRSLQSRQRIVVPISIVTGNVPRFITSITKLNLMPRPGLVLRLSARDFLMSTTLVTSHTDPRERGWPNPIWVHIHDEVLSRQLPEHEKLQLLYQVWAFTRLHLGSENPIRRPISIHYSNQMNEFLRKAGDPEPSYLKAFTERNRFGYVPRPFM